MVTLEGRLDGNTADDFGKVLEQNLAAGEREVVLDVTKLEFVSSAGLREFIQLIRRLEAVKARPAVFGLSASVEQVLQVTGLEALFHRTNDLASALAAVAGKGEARAGFFGRLFGGSA